MNSKEEIALQLTLKAIESGNVIKGSLGINSNTSENISGKNTFNANEIAKFYTTIYNAINTDSDFVVQTSE